MDYWASTEEPDAEMVYNDKELAQPNWHNKCWSPT